MTDHGEGKSGGRGRPWLAPALLGVAVLLAYLNAFPAAFQFDDYNVIVDNPGVHGWAAWRAGLGGIRPLLKATYTLNWTLGPGPFGFHALNLAIHGTNAILVFALFRRFLERGPRETRFPAARGCALSAALLFALHPLQTEAVTYVSGRSSSLMALFYLGSLLAYVVGRERNARIWIAVISPGLFLFALLTKETALTLPFALVLWEATDPAPQAGGSRCFRGPAVHLGLLVLFALFLSLHGGYGRLLAGYFHTRGVGDNLLTQLGAVTYLMSKWGWPRGLNIDPHLPTVRAWTGPLALAAVLVAAALALGLLQLRRRPWLAFGLLWCLLHLLPTNSLVPRPDVVNERQFYLASAGLALVLVVGLEQAVARGALARWTPVGWSALALGLLALTTLRNRDFRTELTLWERSVQVEPGNPRAHNNLGCALAYAGHPGQARRAFEQAVRLDPTYARARVNLAKVTWAEDASTP